MKQAVKGRPTLFKEAYCAQAFKMCLLGATDAQLADFFGIQIATLFLWKKKHPAFIEALKQGKAQADATVAQSLFKLATGYSIDNKHIPANVTACIFWLKNRQPHNWRDKQQVEHSINDSAAALTDEQLLHIASAGSERAVKKKKSTRDIH